MGISISGISSGLDTVSMVSDLMRIERLPFTRLQEDKAYAASKQGVLRQINTKATALKDLAFNLSMKGEWNTFKGTIGEGGDKFIGASVKENAKPGTYTVDVKQLAQGSTWSTGNLNMTGSGASFNGQKVTVFKGDNVVEFEIKDAATIKDVIDQVASGFNSAGTGLNSSIINTSSTNKVLSLFSKDTGTDNEIELGNSKDGNKTIIKMDDSLKSLLGLEKKQPAKNTIVEVNGITVERNSLDISDVIDGVTLTAKEVGKTSLTVQKDDSKLMEQLDKFVTSFNAVMTDITSNLKKGAALQGNSVLKSLQDELVKMTSSMIEVDGKKMSLSFYGLEVNKGLTRASDMNNQLSLDKTKFSKALADDPEGMKNFISNLMGSFDKKLTEFTRASDGILTTAIKGFNDTIQNYDERLESMEFRLSAKEQRLKSQFSTMEVALGGLKNQQNWLAGQFNMLMNQATQK